MRLWSCMYEWQDSTATRSTLNDLKRVESRPIAQSSRVGTETRTRASPPAAGGQSGIGISSPAYDLTRPKTRAATLLRTASFRP